MKRVKWLDCTLRDGGYVNDWNFGHSIIIGTYKRLEAAGADFIEVGFLDDRREFDINRTITPNTDGFNEIFKGVEKKHAIPVAMIDYGTCSIDNIGPCDSTFIDGIRVIFKKEKIDIALPFCKQIKEKGYKLFIQAISITSYSDEEMIDYIKKINEIKPYAFSIVDTYGLLDRSYLKRYFDLFEKYLDPEISVGYHAHNNFQLAFSNSMDFLSFESDRQLVADATIYGMGKSAGNCTSELLTMHMNQKYGTHYDISQILEAFDTYLAPIYQKTYWGYRYTFYIAAMQKVHPSYVKYLLDKKTLSVTAINEILEKIPEEKKLLYDEALIEKLYIKYQSREINDKSDLAKLKNELEGKTILLLGPGSSIKKESTKIKEFINENHPVTISLNFIPKAYEVEYAFLSNAKRFNNLVDLYVASKEEAPKLLITSNINSVDWVPHCTFNYQNLINVEYKNSDNALLLFLTVLNNIGIKRVYLAGFDGFTKDSPDYYDVSKSFAGNETYRVLTNDVTKNALSEINKSLETIFITKTLYKD